MEHNHIFSPQGNTTIAELLDRYHNEVVETQRSSESTTH